MVTIGQGRMTPGQDRAQMFVYAVLGAPIILGNDIRKMNQATQALVTASEVLRVDQDTDCVQGSLLHALGDTEVWGKPLNDSTFAVALLNKGSTSETVTVFFNDDGNCGGSCNGGDFYPAYFSSASVRDLWLKTDLGTHRNSFSATIPPMDAGIYKITPLTK